MAFAGSERWLPQPLARRLRRYVEGGGVVARFGARAFLRPTLVDRSRALAPARPLATNVFGERTKELLRTDPAPLVVETDELELFGGGDRFVGEFTLFEPSAALPGGQGPRSAAGRDPGAPAFVAYELGKGLVIRSGTPQWARELSEGRLGVEVPRATRRIWRLLGRAG